MLGPIWSDTLHAPRDEENISSTPYRQIDLARSRCTNRACEIARDRVGGSRSSQGHIRANDRVEYVPEISTTPGIVTNRRNHRKRRPAAHGLAWLVSAASAPTRGRRAMRRGAPFSLSSSARNKPYMWEHLRITFYALVTTAGALL